MKNQAIDPAVLRLALLRARYWAGRGRAFRRLRARPRREAGPGEVGGGQVAAGDWSRVAAIFEEGAAVLAAQVKNRRAGR